MKLLFWTPIPTHHQACFIDSLRSRDIDLKVCYFQAVPAERLAQGWSDFRCESDIEFCAQSSEHALRVISDWRERIHLVPGYGTSFSRSLAVFLSRQRVPWAHFSEPSSPGWRWWANYPLKRWYADLVNRHALGAFGYGIMALRDFGGWGIDPVKGALLPYGIPAVDQRMGADRECANFLAGRPSFLYLGVLNHRKATDVVLRAFAEIYRKGTEWRLLMVGRNQSGVLYTDLAERLGIRDSVLFRGPIPANQVYTVMQTAQVALLPSRFDGWGATLPEGASCGMALIGSDRTGSAYHLIDPAINGFRVKAGDVRSLVMGMSVYSRDPSIAALHGQRSRSLFEQYTPDRAAERCLSVLRTWLV